MEPQMMRGSFIFSTDNTRICCQSWRHGCVKYAVSSGGTLLRVATNTFPCRTAFGAIKFNIHDCNIRYNKNLRLYSRLMSKLIK